jgi:hypothetical protein
LSTNSATSQIDLGSIVNFSLYASNGAVSSTATLEVTGNINTDICAIIGITPALVVNRTIHNTNSITAQADLHLNAAVAQITAATTTALHIPVFGNGEA